ncbi:hypothetical protein AV530_003549 [Patagioenas fasciata monilis]|uniref:Uncharacterized protein n=1 Tax=Patagioenas fasciata monilis TaxID=372326 RepID=A0A1V4K362_PATFA|nr:hypothetical protein AV530_003549 [Patagioenas fasciata monilis]
MEWKAAAICHPVLVKTTTVICFWRFELNAYTYHQPNLAVLLWKCKQAMPGMEIMTPKILHPRYNTIPSKRPQSKLGT